MNQDSSRIRRNKSGVLWSSNLGDLDVKSYQPKAPFLENHISDPRRCCTSEFLHVLENDQVLLVHPQQRRGSPYKFSKGVKNWLISVLATRTLEP